MESVLSTHFKRVEVALASLIDSIAKYNPNPNHANDLVAANAELDKGLEQLITHQLNYARILSLRKISKSLDNQIRDTLENLASIRKEIISTPATNPISSANSISYTELLDYARRISKFTSPPSYRDPVTNIEVTETTNSKKLNEVSDLELDEDKTNNGLGATNGQKNFSPTSNKFDRAQASIDVASTSQTTIMNNNNIWFEYLNPRSEKPWTPWPSEETIRRGALASIQILVNQGIDLATFDPEKSAELEAERKRVVEEEDKLREEQRRQIEADRNGRQNITTTSDSILDGKKPPSSQTKVFELETFDDDDDDDES